MTDVPSMSITLPFEELAFTAPSSHLTESKTASWYGVCSCSVLEELSELLVEVEQTTWGKAELVLDKLEKAWEDKWNK